MKVKLVENSVNKKVGSVIVVKVISQYKIPGTSLMRKTRNRPRSPSHELAAWVFSIPEEL